MTAPVEKLGALHAAMADMYLDMIKPRVVKLFDAEGNPAGERIEFPSPAEMNAANTFLKNNNITATEESSDALAKMKAEMAARRAERGSRPMPARSLGLDDPLAGETLQ